MRVHRIAALKGDGIGPCLVAAGLEALAACAAQDGGFRLEVEIFDRALAGADLERLQGFDAILAGAAGADGSVEHAASWPASAALCKHLGLGVTMRPIRMLRGLTSPLRDVAGPELNWMIIGANRIGEIGSPDGQARLRQVLRYAFQMARQRPRKLLTVVVPPKTVDHGGSSWSESAADIAQGYPDVVWSQTPVELIIMRMALEPHSLDTIVASSGDADLLSSLAAAFAGSPGLAASARLNPEQSTPALFEPLYGSGLEACARCTANPIAAFWAAGLMLNHLGEKDAAARLMHAVEDITADPALHTPDLGGNCTVETLTSAVCDAVRRSKS